MQTLTAEVLDIIEDLAADHDATVRSYSGRGMYGDECLGISIDGDETEFAMKLASAVAAEDPDAAERLADQVCYDSMGRRAILYFPRTAAP